MSRPIEGWAVRNAVGEIMLPVYRTRREIIASFAGWHEGSWDTIRRRYNLSVVKVRVEERSKP